MGSMEKDKEMATAIAEWERQGKPGLFFDWLYQYDKKLWWRQFRPVWDKMWGRLR